MPETDAVATALVTETSGNDDAATQQNQANGKSATDAGANWANGLADDIKKQMARFKSVDALAKSYVELERYSSKPVQDMTPEEREKFAKRLGRPETPDALELSGYVLPEGIQRSKDADKELQKVIWEMQALPPKEQAKHIHEWAMKKAGDGYLAMKQAGAKALEESENVLRKEWGADYDANKATVERVARLAGDEFTQWLNSSPGKSAVVRKALFALGKTMRDDTFVDGKPVPRENPNSRSGMVVDFSKVPGLRGSR
jgi:hypothetical protein